MPTICRYPSAAKLIYRKGHKMTFIKMLLSFTPTLSATVEKDCSIIRIEFGGKDATKQMNATWNALHDEIEAEANEQ